MVHFLSAEGKAADTNSTFADASPPACSGPAELATPGAGTSTSLPSPLPVMASGRQWPDAIALVDAAGRLICGLTMVDDVVRGR